MRRQILSRSLLTVAAASGILAVTGGIASADSEAGSGQNALRHSADDLSQQVANEAAAGTAAATANTAAANTAAADTAAANTTEANTSANGAAADAAAGATAAGGASAVSEAHGSPGILSGNTLSIPVHAPINVCGDSVDVVGLLNPAFGSSCANGTTSHAAPVRQAQPPAQTPVATPELHTQLAETGMSGGTMSAAAGASAVMLLGGTLVYRRSARAARIRRTYS